MMNKRYQVTLREDVAELLEKLSLEKGVSKSAIVTLAIRNYAEAVKKVVQK